MTALTTAVTRVGGEDKRPIRDLFDEPGSTRPKLRRRTRPEEPIETHRGTAALVRLYSWGRPGDDRFSLNVVPIVSGQRAGGITFSGTSFGELRQVAAEIYPPATTGEAAVLRDVERCLRRATKQLSLDLPPPLATEPAGR
jgi:hypothetical protein